MLVAGPLVAWIAGALDVVAGGVSAIGTGLIGMGIPKDSVVQYELADTSSGRTAATPGKLRPTGRMNSLTGAKT